MSKVRSQPVDEAAPPAHDDDVADIFRTMRDALGLSSDDLAKKLNTQVSVIAALENGELANLPQWSETERVVTNYAAMFALDCRPILRRIALRKSVDQGEAVAPAAGQSPQPRASRARTPKARAPKDRTRGAGTRAKGLGPAQIVGFAVGLMGILALLVAAAYMITTLAPDGAQRASAPAAGMPMQSSQTGQARPNSVTIHRTPLPQAVEAPAPKDGVDREAANPDKSSPGTP